MSTLQYTQKYKLIILFIHTYTLSHSLWNKYETMNIVALICEFGPKSRDHPMLIQLNPPEKGKRYKQKSPRGPKGLRELTHH